VIWLGVGPMFVGVTTAANAGVPAHKAGLAAALLSPGRAMDFPPPADPY
jgi:hypothetical protein